MSQDSQGSSNSHNLTGWTFHQDTSKSYRYPRSCLSFKDFWESPQLKETQNGIQLLLLLVVLMLLLLLLMLLLLLLILVGNGIETGSVMFSIHVLIFHPSNIKMAVQQETSFNHWKTNWWRLKAYCSKNCLWKRFLLDNFLVHKHKL